MSRAFSPPDTLSSEDVRTVADVRRTVWINGIFGLLAGSTSCSLGHVILQKIQTKYVNVEPGMDKQRNSLTLMQKMLKPLPPLGRNTFLLSLLGGGALGSFIMSTTAGKNAAYLLHPIFEIGRNEHAGQSPYQIALSKSKKQSLHDLPPQTLDEDELDAEHHRVRSLQRRASIKERLEMGHSLSSTHAIWPQQEDEDITKVRGVGRAEAWEKRQSQRREWVHNRIEKGRALSDATGGHWDE